MMRRDILEREVRKAEFAQQSLQRLGRYFAPYKTTLYFVGALILLTTGLQLFVPYLIGQTIDCFVTPGIGDADSSCQLVSDPQEPDTGALSVMAVVMVGMNIIAAVGNGFLLYLMAYAGQQVLTQLRSDVFDRIHSLNLGYYDKNPAGDIMSRLTNDADQIATAVNFGLVRVGSQILTLFGSLVVMFIIHPPLAIFSTFVVPIMLATTFLFARWARAAFRKTRLEMGEVNADLQESISGVREAQAFGREGENIQRFRERNAANRDANIRAVTITSGLQPMLNLLGVIGQAMIIGLGSLWAIRGDAVLGYPVTIGVLIAFLVYLQRLYQPVRIIGQLWAQIQSALAGAERMFMLIDEHPELEDKPAATALPDIKGHIRYENVHFHYIPDEPVLRGVDFEIQPGQTIAIVGPTGAGKTSIVSLLGRFYDVNEGRILIDGHDLRDVTQSSLRKQVGIVLQDNFLWSDTIANNIRYGNLNASEEDVINAAKLARAHDFIERMAEGYETVLGERGAGLSLGQRQLIAIARAALSDPRILILDEATSNVDTRTEKLIQSALDDLMANRTSLVIAHRLSTIRNADRVLVVVAGQVVESGKHEELLEKQGTYYDLYMSQFRYEEQPTTEQPASVGAD
jgi:ATP-binding cassette, subfamily B, multidrug efflux pump